MPPPSTRRFLHPYSASSNYTTSTAVNVTACLFPNCIFPPVDLPSPPPILSFPVPDAFVIHVRHSNRILPHFLIAAATLIAVSFLLFCFLLRLRRRRLHLNRQAIHPDVNGPHSLHNIDLFGNGSSSLFLDSFDGTHHVWGIKTVGLDESLIKSIGSRVYKTGGRSEDCSVCLGAFRDEEMVKILPKCKHVFHRECIDTWLKAHVNCPICRTPVLDGGVLKLDQLEMVSPNRDLECNDDDSSSSLNSRRNGREDGNEVQAMRRSVSMDAFGIGMLRGELEKRKKEIEFGDGYDKNGVVKMKMAMSSRSGRLFFPRYGRGSSASVLPF